MLSVYKYSSFGEGGRRMFLSAHHLRYLEQIFNNDRNCFDQSGQVSLITRKLHWTVPKFSANYLKVNVAEQDKEDWSFSKKWSVAQHVRDKRVWLAPWACSLARPRVSRGVPLRAASCSVGLKGGNGNGREVDEAGQSAYRHSNTVFKSPWLHW